MEEAADNSVVDVSPDPGALVLGGMLFKLPYVALVPGSARDTGPLLEVEGIEAYPSEGELLFTTVRVRQRPNLWEYIWLYTDDDAEVVPEERILGDRTPDENRELNLQLMNDSKSIAVAVALQELGYDAIRADGALIVETVADSAAEGLLVAGDTVVAIDGEPVEVTADLVDILEGRSPGQEVILTVERLMDPDGDGGQGADQGDAEGSEVEHLMETIEVSVVLGAKPDDPEAAFLGVAPIDRVDLSEDFDFTVDIDAGSVGGPSAGLAFTLAVLDELTEGELTGGAMVAVTGTIDVSGRVGTVGGVVQKTAAVAELGADVFLVPAGLDSAELDAVFARAGDEVRVIPVATLDEALDALADLGGEVDAVEEFAASNPS